MNVQKSPIGFASQRSNRRAVGALPENDYQLHRRHFLKKALWAAGLSVFGILPSGCTTKWSLLPPRAISWVMKPLSSAQTEETVLPDGRVRLHIEH
jgi:hypothetical protein